jgi:hypothetical protein
VRSRSREVAKISRDGDLRHRRGDLDRRLLRLADQCGELVGHAVKARFERADFIRAVQLQTLREVARAHDVDDLQHLRHRRGDRAQQPVTGQHGGDGGDQQHHEQHDTGRLDRAADAFGGLVGVGLVVVHQLAHGNPAGFPDRRELCVEDTRGVLFRGRQSGHQRRLDRQVLRVLLPEVVEEVTVFLAEDGRAVIVEQLLQRLLCLD